MFGSKGSGEGDIDIITGDFKTREGFVQDKKYGAL